MSFIVKLWLFRVQRGRGPDRSRWQPSLLVSLAGFALTSPDRKLTFDVKPVRQPPVGNGVVRVLMIEARWAIHIAMTPTCACSRSPTCWDIRSLHPWCGLSSDGPAARPYSTAPGSGDGPGQKVLEYGRA